MDEITLRVAVTIVAPLGISWLAAKRSAERAGVPCVVMAPGFAGTRDTGGLATTREASPPPDLTWCCSTIAVSPRRVDRPASWCRSRRQRQDYQAAIACARQLPGVDPERIVLWGISFSGGHVVRVAAEDGRIAAVMR